MGLMVATKSKELIMEKRDTGECGVAGQEI